MKQYCRYCAFAHYGDQMWCEKKEETMPDSAAKAVNHCKDFGFNELDVFGTEDKNGEWHKYKPREPVIKQCEGQTSLFEFTVKY